MFANEIMFKLITMDYIIIVIFFYFFISIIKVDIGESGGGKMNPLMHLSIDPSIYPSK